VDRVSARLRLVEPHEDPVRAVHRNQFSPRQSDLPIGYFDESLGARIERLGGKAVGIVMSIVAIFIVLGLTFNWFA
jgi:hypothetical protein